MIFLKVALLSIMVSFKTSTGVVSVDNWGYELQGLSGSALTPDLLASATHDLLVIDASRDGDRWRAVFGWRDHANEGRHGRTVRGSVLYLDR